MDKTNHQTKPRDAKFDPKSDAEKLWADLQARYAAGPGNLAVVQAENRKRWAA